MARDLNRLFEDLQNSREVYVTQDGRVERVDEANENAAREEAREGTSRPRTQLKPEIFGGRIPLTVFDGFFSQAHQTAAQFEGETGAIGVGPDPFTITEFIPSGPNARRSASTFQLDPEYLQPLLDDAEARGLCFNCIWHSHPEGCPSPSGTDRAAALSMLRDRDWGLSGHVFMPISVRENGGFETRFFVAEGSEARIHEVAPLVISSPASALSKSSVSRTSLDRRELLANGWDASLRKGEHGQAWRLERKSIVLWLLLPEEYPASPPDVLFEDGKQLLRLSPREVPEMLAWSSLHSIAALAEQAHKAVKDSREAEALILRPRLVHVARRLLAAPMTAGRS